MRLRFFLKPLDTIFFGEEKSPFKQEYFQQSRMLPQQTTVLGFLRYEALRRSGKLGKDPRTTDWDSLIGGASFDGSASQAFGVISDISAVSIFDMKAKHDLYPVRNPSGFSPIEVSSARVSFGDDSLDWESLCLFEKAGYRRFDPKDHDQFSLMFTDFKGSSRKAECEDAKGHRDLHGYGKPIEKTGVFWKDVRPGITKSYVGVPGDSGYFKTSFWRMMPGLAYSFTAEVEDHRDLKAADWKNGTAIVRFGGDRSMYSVQVTDAAKPAENGNGNFFVLLSDALVGNGIYDHCRAAVTDTRHFRNLRTTNRSDWFNKRPNDWDTWSKDTKESKSTEAKVFMKYGSVLVAKEGCAALLAEKLMSEAAYRNIGYNQFKQSEQLPTFDQDDKKH